MSRKRVTLPIEQLVDVERHAADRFFTTWRCRLCRTRTGALDRETALNEAARHLAEQHNAQGGHHRKPHVRQRRNR